METTDKTLVIIDACNEFLALNGYEHPLAPVIGAARASLVGRMQGLSRVSLVLQIIHDITGIAPADVIGKRRGKYPVTDARHIFCKMCYDLLNMSNREIGAELSGRDHSTVVNARQTAEDYISTDPAFAKKYQQCIDLYKAMRVLSKTLPVKSSEPMLAELFIDL